MLILFYFGRTVMLTQEELDTIAAIKKGKDSQEIEVPVNGEESFAKYT